MKRAVVNDGEERFRRDESFDRRKVWVKEKVLMEVGKDGAARCWESERKAWAPHLEVITIQECEAESSRGKSLWDADFGVPAHGE